MYGSWCYYLQFAKDGREQQIVVINTATILFCFSTLDHDCHYLPHQHNNYFIYLLIVNRRSSPEYIQTTQRWQFDRRPKVFMHILHTLFFLLEECISDLEKFHVRFCVFSDYYLAKGVCPECTKFPLIWSKSISKPSCFRANSIAKHCFNSITT